MKELPCYTTFIVTLPESSGNDEVLAKSTFHKLELIKKINGLTMDSLDEHFIDFQGTKYSIKTHWIDGPHYQSHKPCQQCKSASFDKNHSTQDIELLLVSEICSDKIIDLRSKKALQILSKFLQEIDAGPKTDWCMCKKCFAKIET